MAKVLQNLKLHFPIFVFYVGVIGYELSLNILGQLVPNSRGSIFESRIRFLTYWNMVLQTLFFTVCVLADLIAKNDQNHVLRRLQNRIMVSLAYPLAMFVGITFWSIYFVDRELIFPKAMDAFFPTWLNHCMHTNIMVFMLVEFFTTEYSYSPRSQNIKILLTVMITYLVWLFIIYGATSVWVYPILHVLEWPLKIAFFIGCLGLVLGLYFSGEKLNQVINKGKARGADLTAVQSEEKLAQPTTSGKGKKQK